MLSSSALPQMEAQMGSMINCQLRPNKVREENVLSAFESVPRDIFVPIADRALAYADCRFDLGAGRMMLEPMVLARLLQALNVKDTDHALVIAAGTGYTAALLAHMAGSVIAVESDANLATQASSLIAQVGISNATVVSAPLTSGYAGQAPYQVIFIEGGVQDVAPALLNQLADGGRLVAIRRNHPHSRVGEATLWTKTAQGVVTTPLFDAAAPLLEDFSAPLPFAL